MKLEIHNMAGHLIRRLHQVSVSVFNESVSADGFSITSVQFAAMNALRVNPGIDQRTLSELIAYDRATIGGVVDRLEAKGYVKRRVNPTDRRARVVELTEAGDQVLAEVIPRVREAQVRMLTGLDDAERARFLALAKKAIEAASVPENPDPVD